MFIISDLEIMKFDWSICIGVGLCVASTLLVATKVVHPKHLMLLLLYIKSFPLVSHWKALTETATADLAVAAGDSLLGPSAERSAATFGGFSVFKSSGKIKAESGF